ncbi:Tc toxin subunit A [Pseudomonas sp. RT6P73]
MRAAPSSGDEKALVPLPTFKNLFNPNTDGSAPVGSNENRASTTAYMVALAEWVRDKIVPQGSSEAIPLQTRRPDVPKMLIDHMAVNQEQSRLAMVNAVLEAQIKAKLNITDVKAYLRTLRYNNGLPYDHDFASISHVIQAVLKDRSLGEVIRLVDRSYPYFKNPGAVGDRSNVAFQSSIGLGPLQLRLLLESPYFPSTAEQAKACLRRVDPLTRLVDPDPKKSAEDFYRDNFGQLGVALASLRMLWIFAEVTRLDQRGVESLLGLGTFTPKLSANAPAIGNPDVPATGVLSGARYVHGGEGPAIELQRTGISGQMRLHNIGEDDSESSQLQHRVDRLNRKCRLDRMLQLQSDETDELIDAATQAEYRGTGEGSLWIRTNTLRCLGLFKMLNSLYGCKAEQFAALINVLSVYGRDGQLSHFDRVYNRHTMYGEPLRIDDKEFAIVPLTKADEETVHQICSALEINFETYRFLAMVIARAYGLKTHLKRSQAIFSSFWRLVWLARLLKLTAIESTALLQTLSNGEGLVGQLAGEPAVSSHGAGDGADALSAIHALMTCSDWLKEYGLSVLWTVENVNPVYVPAVWSEAQEQFLRKLRSQVLPVLVLQATLLEEGAPLRDSSQVLIDWMQRLNRLVGHHGVVIGRHDQTETQYLEYIRVEIERVVCEVLGSNAGDTERERLQSIISVIVLRCRDEQRVVVEEGLSVYLKLDSLLTAQVLSWAEGHPYDFLDKALSLSPDQPSLARQVLREPDEFLNMLAELERRGRIADKLGLTPQMLQTLLTDEQYQWFSLESPYEISIQSVYYLAFYRRMITEARQPEEKMLDYLRQVNLLPDDLSPDALQLIRDAAASKLAAFFGCGIKHVLTCAEHISQVSEDGDRRGWPILCTLEHLDLLSRTLELAKKGMDTTAAFGLGKLKSLDQEPEYAGAAKNALDSLARFTNLTTPPDSAEVGQSITTRCVVDSPKLIARVSQEVAEFELILLDFYGNPLKGVVVYWKTDLGAILNPETKTDDQGRTWALLQAGWSVGTAHVSYYLPLHEPIYAPSVLIGCDEATLYFSSELVSPLPEHSLLAGHLSVQEAWAELRDLYGNKGMHRQVAWSTTHGEIRPADPRTDRDGITRVWISSLSPGEATISVLDVESGTSIDFNGSIKFADKPRILDKPEAVTVAMVGQLLTMRCKVVGLDGSPVAEESVIWWTSVDEAKTEQPSDQNGFSSFSVTPLSIGYLTIYAQLGNDLVIEQVQAQVRVQNSAMIQNHSADFKYPIVGDPKPIWFWVDVRATIAPTSSPVPNYPVTWKCVPQPDFTARESVTIATDAQGRSAYPFNASIAGEFKVTAQLELHPAELEAFTVKAIPAIGWKIEFVSGSHRATFDPAIDKLTLLRNGNYSLEITPLETGLVGSKGAVGWGSVYTTQALGMVFNPPLATRFTFEPNAPFILNIATGDIRNGLFELSLVCDRLSQALVFRGELLKRLPTRRPASS